jgi:hypothetical protein
MRIAGIVLDIYDDPRGLVLRNKLAALKQKLPTKLAASRLLTTDELEELPDRLFGLVATNHGNVLRKYAMHDPEHTTISILYFLECGHLLPDDVQAKVASNLVVGCSWYDLQPPTDLIKKAMIGKALTVGFGAMDMAHRARSGSEKAHERMDEFRAAQASGTKTASGRTVELTKEQDNAMQRGDGPESGHIFGLFDLFSKLDSTHKKLDKQLEKRDQIDPVMAKKADLTGTEIMPQGTLRNHPVRSSPSKSLDLPQKTSALLASAEWAHCGDLTLFDGHVKKKQASAVHYALPHLERYPIDTTAQVKQAAAYFDDHLHSFPLEERRAYAVSVAQRADELGVKLSGAVMNYAGTEYGENVEAQLHARITAFMGTGHEEVYELLLEKKAEIDPMVMVNMIMGADVETGASGSYNRPGVGFLDPYAAVYGTKHAADECETYSWSAGNDYVSGMQLKSLSERTAKLDELFGDGFASSFAKDPVGIFKSMPDPQKVVLSRLAAAT